MSLVTATVAVAAVEEDRPTSLEDLIAAEGEETGNPPALCFPPLLLKLKFWV